MSRTFVLLSFLLLSGTAFAKPETYRLDSDHTNIDWRISHFGFSNPSGKFPGAQGTLVLDEDKPQSSSVTMSLKVADIVTGIPALNEHLMGKDFFNAAQYPDASFKSRSVTMTGKDSAKVLGDLTLRGVTKPVTLDVKLNKIGINMMKKKTAGFTATTMIKRSDFGMTSFLPDLGDTIDLRIESEANLDAPNENN